ncbi:MAG: NAD-dependent epimerase/dehydratase family protein [Bdellovibrionota bacterium]
MMKALVTGASGFIGSTLVETLVQKDFDVRVLMRRSSSAANLEGMKYTRIDGDLSDFESLKRAVQGTNYVFHLAGLTAARDEEVFFKANAAGTELLARAVSETSGLPSRFVYISSLAAAGPSSSTEPRTEDQVEKPVSAYGRSKLQGERELFKYKDKFPITIVRPPMVYGPKDKGVFVVIRTVNRGLMPILKGSSSPDGHKYYSAVHVDDLCNGIMLAATSNDSLGEIFYISGDGIYSYQELLNTMARCLKKRGLRFSVPGGVIKAVAAGFSVIGAVTGGSFPINLDKVNELIPDFWTCSNNKAKELLHFSPKFDLEIGMSQTIEWYKQKKWI